MKKLNNILPGPQPWLLCAVILYLLSFLFSEAVSSRSEIGVERKKLESYLHAKENEFYRLVADSLLIKRLANRTESNEELKKIAKGKTGIFIYRKYPLAVSDVLFWSNQNSYPKDEAVVAADGEYFNQRNNGFYVSVRKSIPEDQDGDSLVVIGMIPILFDYVIDFAQLQEEFTYSKEAFNKISISDLPTQDSITGLSGKRLFYISLKSQSIRTGTSNVASFFRVMALLLLLIYIHFMAERVSRRYGFWKALGFLAIVLISLRLFSYFTNFPVNLRQFILFDPQVYGSNAVHKSLGDLLINSALFCWIILFASQKLDSKDDYNLPLGKRNWLFGLIGILLIVFFTFMVAYTIRSLAADSSISFDVINFFSLTTFTIFGFISLAVIGVGFYYFMRIMVPFVASVFEVNFYVVYLIIAFSGLTFLTFEIDNPLLSFYVIVLAWLVFYTFLVRLRRFTINNRRQTMAGALFWIFLFSVSITAIIIDANREKEWEQRKQNAIKIDERSDPYNEKELGISLTYIDDNFLTPNFYRFENETSSQFLRDSILKGSNNYLHKYNSEMYVFDANNKPLFNDEPESFNTLETIIRVQGKETNVDSLSYYETGFGKYTFIFRRVIKDVSGKFIGTIFITSYPEQYASKALTPELFRRSGQTDDALGYSYGIYKDNKLVTGPFNKYSFSTILNPAKTPIDRFRRDTYGSVDELWYKAKNDKIIVIAREKNTILEAITLFSYIFCVFLFLVAIFNFLVLLLRVGGNIKEFRRLLEWNIRTQVHSTIIMISILSFVIIGVATISFFIQRYDQNNEERLSRTMEIVVKELEKKLDERIALDDQLPIYDSVANEAVLRLVNDVAEIHNVDVNVYDTSGSLHVTSQPIVYRDGYLSRKIHPLAFYHLNKLRQVQHVQQEKLSTISYLSIYAPLRGGTNGLAYAYINIPYFSSQSGLKQEISNFLVAIINLNAFIFLIAGVIALFITNRVTRSFLFISEKMKEVNLGKTNEEIDWKRDDEIGGLVREYNKMVKKLETSAEALARSEREGAWREMARQVAHEIKNPLTPMKLSVQFLQKSIDNNSANVKELTGNVAKTLIEQIDHLSKIAFDFSQFANIGNTKIETFDINDVINSMDNLYKANHALDIELNTLPEKILVRADKTQMNRLFTNLMQNAIEACNGDNACKIELNEMKHDGVVRVSVKDNGSGIPADMQSKIFIPNFTTKTSGTGLGLAMCKGIVEQAGGKIWFETEIGKGSTFFVELPAIN